MDLQPDPNQASPPGSSQWSTLLQKDEDAARQSEWQISEGLKFILTWGIGVIGVAAAIVFGIWAPMSYKATVESNRNADLAQSSMMSALTQANSQATVLYKYQTAAMDYQSSAVDYQSSAAKAMESVNSRMVAMGQLALVDFCMKYTNYTVCQSYFETLSFRSLVNYLADATPTNSHQDQSISSTHRISTPTSAAVTPTTTTGATTQKSGTNTEAGTTGTLAPAARGGPDPAVLGVIFGVLVGVGALLGLLIWIFRRGRRGKRVNAST